MVSTRRIVQQAKTYDLPVMFHSCGNISDIIPDLIECGVDMIDPIQVSAENMSTENLRGFAGKISFHGGVSTQSTLPFGTAEEVRESTVKLIQALGPFGLVVAPDQEIMEGTPTENIQALFDAVHEYKP